MKYYGKITDNKDFVTKEYVDNHSGSDVKQPLYVGGTAPYHEEYAFWIDTSSTGGGLKYYNGSAWESVPVQGGSGAKLLTVGDTIKINNLYTDGRTGNDEFVVAGLGMDGTVKLISKFTVATLNPTMDEDQSPPIIYNNGATLMVQNFYNILSSSVKSAIMTSTTDYTEFWHIIEDDWETGEVIEWDETRHYQFTGQMNFLSYDILQSLSQQQLLKIFPHSSSSEKYVILGSRWEALSISGTYGSNYCVTTSASGAQITTGISFYGGGLGDSAQFRPVFNIDLSQVDWSAVQD